MNLDPAKVLVILVVALIVLGPERLPRVARQLGALWREMTTTRDRLVNEIKDQVPGLPDPRDLRGVLFDPTRSTATSRPSSDGQPSQTSPAGTDAPRLWRPDDVPAPQKAERSSSGVGDPSMN